MSPEAQRIALAEFCGVELHRKIQDRYYVTREMAIDAQNPELEGSLFQDEEWEHIEPPDYLSDLNAMHEAITIATAKSGFEFQAMFQLRLQEVVERRWRDLNREQIGFWMNNATAAQRAEALLRTIGRWQE